MGLTITKSTFEPEDYTRFSERLHVSLDVLRQLLQKDGFGVGPVSIGAELELSLVDTDGLPLLLNSEVVEAASDARFTLELDRFNVECGTQPVFLARRPFTALGAELRQSLELVTAAAGGLGASVAMVGILPTLMAEHLNPDAMTAIPRYEALARSLRHRRGAPFHLRINGAEPLDLRFDHVTLEGAATSFQLHLRVDPSRFASVHNAVQMATAPVLAAAGNSPTFLGHHLWEETRITLFKHAVDERTAEQGDAEARVSFGTRWVEQSAYELFAESVQLHAPLLPVLADEDPVATLERGVAPGLTELRLHHGTVWRWNRAVYDPIDGGHLRVELRALPSGPTIGDMLASSAFHVGLAFALAADPKEWTRRLPFDVAHSNFYRAAQHGLKAQLRWPSRRGLRSVAARDLIVELLPLAAEGLERAGVDSAEQSELLSTFAARAASGRTGSWWQRQMLSKLERQYGRAVALRRMLRAYMLHSDSGIPVHRWPLEEGTS